MLIKDAESAENALAEARTRVKRALENIGSKEFLSKKALVTWWEACENEKRIELALKDAKAKLGKIGHPMDGFCVLAPDGDPGGPKPATGQTLIF